MINVHDNRAANERRLDKLECGQFFMINEILYRRCWWELETFDRIAYEDDCLVCMRIDSGELVVLRFDQWVEPVNDSQIELMVED